MSHTVLDLVSTSCEKYLEAEGRPLVKNSTNDVTLIGIDNNIHPCV